jgi:hypothetical protein
MTLVAKLPPISMTPAGNLQTVSTQAADFATSSACVVDTGGKFATSVKDADDIVGTISGCRHLKVNLKAKMYIYVNFSTQRCPNKIIKKFCDWRFFPFAYGVNDTGGALWTANIFRVFLYAPVKEARILLRICGFVMQERLLSDVHVSTWKWIKYSKMNAYLLTSLSGHSNLAERSLWDQPIFLNVYWAQEFIPRNEFRQPM